MDKQKPTTDGQTDEEVYTPYHHEDQKVEVHVMWSSSAFLVLHTVYSKQLSTFLLAL